MSKILKVVRFDGTSDTIVEVDLGIDVPAGKAIKINSASYRQVTVLQGTAQSKGLIVGMGTRQTEQTLMFAGLLVSENDIILYGIPDVDTTTPSEAIQLELKRDKVYAMSPTVFVGKASVAADTDTSDYVFLVDYDLVKLTTDIAVEIATA